MNVLSAQYLEFWIRKHSVISKSLALHMVAIGCCFALSANASVVANGFLGALCWLLNKFTKCPKKDSKLSLELVGYELKVSHLPSYTRLIQYCDCTNIQSSMLSRKKIAGEKLQENQEDLFTSHQMGIKRASK